jgi:hypothetical protein
VNIKIAGKWMFIPLKMVLIGIDPYPYTECVTRSDESVTHVKNTVSFRRSCVCLQGQKELTTNLSRVGCHEVTVPIFHHQKIPRVMATLESSSKISNLYV